MELLSDVLTVKLNVQRLQEADRAYEETDEPLMSDAEYDELRLSTSELIESIDKSELKSEDCVELIEASLYLGSIRNTIVGKDLDNDQVKEHLCQVGGLPKVYTVNEFLVLMADKEKDPNSLSYFYLEPKYDGISLSLIYKDQKIQSALTRGNGYQGEDIFKLVRGVASIPHEVTWKEDTQINGELVISWENFKKINKNSKKKYKTPRSALVAFLNSKDKFRIKTYVDFIPYFKYSAKGVEKKVSELKNNKFKEQIISIWDLSKIKTKIESIENHSKSPEDLCGVTQYPIDGIVITCTQKLRSIAVKPKTIHMATTKIREVKWDLTGKIGKLACTLIVDPVVVNNKEYTKMPIKDFRLFSNNELQVNQDVVVSIENEVLSYSRRAELTEGAQLKRIERPSLCPKCSDPLYNKGYDYYCDNEKCVGALVKSFALINKILKVTVSSKTIEFIIEDGANNIYKYLNKVINTTPLTKKAFLECKVEDLFRIFNIPQFTERDYKMLYLVLTRAEERCNVPKLKTIVHKLSLKDHEIQKFKGKMNKYYEFCDFNVEWIDDFYALLKKHKHW